ncbi:MAG TPA: histone H1 [Petrimonas sp.]|nr:histone H1 [Petrimonas sp.]
MQELVNKINEQISVFQENAKLQAENNNKAAGGRARKSSLELEKLLKEFRKVSIAASK